MYAPVVDMQLSRLVSAVHGHGNIMLEVSSEGDAGTTSLADIVSTHKQNEYT
jgi:hypothetical protein